MSTGRPHLKDSPRVVVVLVTYNSDAVLPGFLASLHGAMAGISDWELSVCDNGSSDATVALLRRWEGPVHIVEAGANLGYSAAINRAVAGVAPADVVVVANPDTRPAPGSVADLVRGLAADGRVGITVPVLRRDDGSPARSLRNEPTLLRLVCESVMGGRRSGRWGPTGEVDHRAWRYEAPSDADWASGAFLAIRGTCADEVGPWDESFFLYGEEADYCLRARDLGWVTRLVPSSEVIHYEGDSGVSPRLWALLCWNRVRLYRRRHGRLTGALYRAVMVAREVVRVPFSAATHREAVAVLLGRRDPLAAFPDRPVDDAEPPDPALG